MSKQNKTPWFHPSVKPVRVGEYEVLTTGIVPGKMRVEHGDVFSLFWDSSMWMLDPLSGNPAFTQQRYWRGLTAPAKESA